jgi:hypothetical protein
MRTEITINDAQCGFQTSAYLPSAIGVTLGDKVRIRMYESI